MGVVRKKSGLSAILAASALCLGLSTATALAGSCPGTVGGLSSTYNLKKGTGFLAVRSRPTTKSRMIGQMFNGEQVEVDRRRGNWLYVYGDNWNGWVYHKYILRGCDGI